MPTTSTTGDTTLQSPSTTTAAPYYFTRSRSRTQSLFATCRPWRQLTNLPSFTRPYTFGETRIRLKLNLTYFRVNYAIITLLILFLSLIYHPISMIVYIMISIGWYYFYFSRDEPLRLFNRTIDDRVVMVGLGVVTVVALVFSGVWLNVLVSLVVGGVVVCLHAVFRGTEDMYLDEEQVGNGGLVSVVGSPMRVAGYGRI